MKSVRVGSLPWSKSTHGKLRVRDSLSLVGQTCMQLPATVPREALSRLRRSRPRATALRVDVSSPKSAFAVEAENICLQESKALTWLYPHSLRTYRFALLFAEARRIEFDRDTLFVAAMMHDIGLTPYVPANQATCFAVRGADAVSTMTSAIGWPNRDRAAEAVAQHLNVRVSRSSRRRCPEGHLINLASGLDVAGLRFRWVYSSALLDVLNAIPLRNFANTIGPVIAAESARAPRTRARYLHRYARLGWAINSSPLLHCED